MPLKVSMMEEADIPAFGIIDEAAMSGWAYADAMFKPGSSRREIAEKFCHDSLGKNPEERWVKVTDTETNEVVAVALWLMKLDPKEPADASAIHQLSSKSNKSTGTEEIPSLWDVSGRMARAFDAEYVGNVPKAVLAILVCHPSHQRRGAGNMLVEWGCREADQKGIICVLTASAKGFPLYLKNGFEVKQVKELDLNPWGYNEVELRRYMIRPAKSLPS